METRFCSGLRSLAIKNSLGWEVLDYCFQSWRLFFKGELEKKTKNLFHDNPFATDYTYPCFLKQRILNLYNGIISSFLSMNYFVLKAPCPPKFIWVFVCLFSVYFCNFVTSFSTCACFLLPLNCCGVWIKIHKQLFFKKIHKHKILCEIRASTWGIL